jgi:hypothetical protein
LKTHRFGLFLGAVLAALFVVFWIWQTPGNLQKLSSTDVDVYLHKLEGKLPGNAMEQAAFLARMRAFGLADDGRPVYMLNAMRYYPELKHGPGMEEVRGTPAEANATYEKAVMPILFRLGAYPLFGGETMEIRADGKAHSNLDGFDPAIDDWSRILVVRYPSRRAFFELLTDPQWLKFAPYKIAALEIALVPASGQVVIPDLRWAVGGACLIVFLGAGWLRAARGKRAERPTDEANGQTSK